VRITSVDGPADDFGSTTNEGSHFYGIGTYLAPTVITGAGQQVYHEADTDDISGPAINA